MWRMSLLHTGGRLSGFCLSNVAKCLLLEDFSASGGRGETGETRTESALAKKKIYSFIGLRRILVNPRERNVVVTRAVAIT